MKSASIYKDRLSDLPDFIILHILSFLNSKQAVQTCILSTRWKNINIPKHLPILRLCSSHFTSLRSFVISVYLAFLLRDHSTTLHTVDFMDSYDFIEPEILKCIVKYAISHNVQFLRISITCDLQQFSPCLFSSQTLTFVDLCVHPAVIASRSKILFPNSLNLPALTTLTLRSFYFCAGDDGCAEPFSAFKKLDTLLIKDCLLLNAQILCISSTTLVNLTVDDSGYLVSYKCKLSTPSLCNLNYSGTLNQKLCHSDLRSLKHVYINNEYTATIFNIDYRLLLNLLQELANIKSLTVSSGNLQVLSCVRDLSKVKLTSLYNLESLQVIVKPNTFESYRTVNFLLQNSPSAKNQEYTRIKVAVINAGFCGKVLAEFYILKRLKSRDTITRSLFPKISFCSMLVLCFNFYLISCFATFWRFIFIHLNIFGSCKSTMKSLHLIICGTKQWLVTTHHDEASSVAHYCLQSLGFAYRTEWCGSHLQYYRFMHPVFSPGFRC